jgi:hypothetical protein
MLDFVGESRMVKEWGKAALDHAIRGEETGWSPPERISRPSSHWF